MSEIERLSADIKKDANLREQVKELGNDSDAFVEWANQHGYDFSAGDLSEYVEAKTSELSEEQLDQVAGGGATSVQSNVEAVTEGAAVTVGVGAVVVAEVAVVT
jgi:predicted ribosomally synthesized peptide with nif11-like leader